MSLFGKPLESLIESDLQNLIDLKVRENRVVEYKGTPPGRSDGDKREFIKDVVSFANSAGGHIIYGMEAVDAVPTAFRGIDGDLIDSEKLRLEAMARTGIEPVIHGLKIEAVALPSAGGNAIIIEIPRGLFGPHMIRGRGAFIARNSAGKTEMDFGEIRAAFIGAETATSKLRDFYASRISKLIENDGIARMANRMRLVVHLLPLESFTPGFRCNIKSLVKARTVSPEDSHPLIPGRDRLPWKTRLSLDGYSQIVNTPDGTLLYAHAFTNGAVEYVNCECDMDQEFYGIAVESTILSSIFALKSVFHHLEIDSPIYAFASLLNTRGCSLVEAGRDYRADQKWEIEADNIFLPDVELPDPLESLDKAFRSSLDVLWNACGVLESPHFKGDGSFERNWKNPGR